MNSLSEELRSANLDSDLLEEAADEIVRLKHQASLDNTKIVGLRDALETIKGSVNELAALALSTVTTLGHSGKQLQVSLGDILEQVRVADQAIRETRDETNLKIGQALK